MANLEEIRMPKEPDINELVRLSLAMPRGDWLTLLFVLEDVAAGFGSQHRDGYMRIHNLIESQIFRETLQ